jgi:hypothetical protein
MKASTWVRLSASIFSMVSVMLMLNQVSVFAQSSDQTAGNLTPSVTIKSQMLNGGFFQVVDIAVPPCSGQCATPNWQTGECTCWEGFTPVPAARMLVDQGTGAQGSTCGSVLYVCVLP